MISRLSQAMIGIVGTIFAALATLVGLLIVSENRLVYFPDPDVIPPRVVVPHLAVTEVYIETADGVTLHGWHGTVPQPVAGIIFFHGNAGNISHRGALYTLFANLRCDFLAVDYRGFGRSGGRPGARAILADALVIGNYARQVLGWDPRHTIVYGRSLGSAPGAYLAGHLAPAGLVLDSAFPRLVDVAAFHYPFLPVRLLMRNRFPVTDYLKVYQGPVLLFHARDDKIVPYEFGQRLADQLGERGTLVTTHGGHNTNIDADRAAYLTALRAFLAQTVIPHGVRRQASGAAEGFLTGRKPHLE